MIGREVVVEGYGPGDLEYPAERGVGRVEVPHVRGAGVLTFLDEQLHHDHSASQGQDGVVDSRGIPLGGAPKVLRPTLGSFGPEP